MATKAKQKTKTESPTDDEDKIPEQEKTAVKNLLKRIERAKKLREDFDTKLLPSLRRMAWGAQNATNEQEIRTNLIFATMATLLPHCYAKNPEIAVAPTEAVGKNAYEQIKKFCKTAQVMLNNLFVEEAGLKACMKANVRSTMTTSVGWVKMTFQESLTGDTLQVKRVNDIQDNLAKVERLAQEVESEEDRAKAEQMREDLKNQIKVIMESAEVGVFKGFHLDRTRTENLLILDESVQEFDDYRNSGALAHRVMMDCDEYAEKFGKKPTKKAATYAQPKPGDIVGENGQPVNLPDEQGIQYYAVWEVASKRDGLIYTVCEGEVGYVREPMVLKPAAERWYQHFALGYNIVEGRWRPLSDVELLQHLQKEYNETRYLFAETRKESIPARFYRKSNDLDQADLEAISNRKPGDLIGIGGNPTKPLRDDIMELQGFQIDPAAFDVSIIRNDMDMLVGLSDASRANLIEAKTATEAEIMRQALMTRVAERQDANEELISEMARAALEIMLQKFTLDEVKQIAGDDAEWPTMEVGEIFRLVRVSVRAGSTGKPNVLKERESWAQIMPVINDTVTQVMELRMAGQFDLANSKIELLKETLLRYDEKLDVDRFVPPQMTAEDGQPQAAVNAMAQAAQMQEQMQAMQEQMQQLQQENQQLQAALDKAKLEEQAKIAQAQRDMQAKQADADTQKAEAAAEAARAESEKAIKSAAETSKIEQARIDAEMKERIEEQRRRDEIDAENQRNRDKLANDLKIAIVKEVLGAMKPTPTKGENGKPGETPEADVGKMLEVAQRIAGVDLAGAQQVVSGKPSAQEQFNERMLQALDAITARLSQQKRVRIKRDADGSILGETLPIE